MYQEKNSTQIAYKKYHDEKKITVYGEIDVKFYVLYPKMIFLCEDSPPKLCIKYVSCAVHLYFYFGFEMTPIFLNIDIFLVHFYIRSER